MLYPPVKTRIHTGAEAAVIAKRMRQRFCFRRKTISPPKRTYRVLSIFMRLLLQLGEEFLYLVEGYALALDRLARRERHYAVAVELRRLGEAGRLLRRYLPVDGDDARREVVGSLGPQKSESFYGFLLRCCYNSVFHSFSPFLFFGLYFVEGMSAFKHFRRREAEGPEPVLRQICALPLRAYEEQLFVLRVLVEALVDLRVVEVGQRRQRRLYRRVY